MTLWNDIPTVTFHTSSKSHWNHYRLNPEWKKIRLRKWKPLLWLVLAIVISRFLSDGFWMAALSDDCFSSTGLDRDEFLSGSGWHPCIVPRCSLEPIEQYLIDRQMDFTDRDPASLADSFFLLIHLCLALLAQLLHRLDKEWIQRPMIWGYQLAKPYSKHLLSFSNTTHSWPYRHEHHSGSAGVNVKAELRK